MLPYNHEKSIYETEELSEPLKRTTKKLLLKDPQRELLSKVFFTLPYIYIKSIFYIFEKKLN